jgi:hypothetical protein
VSDVPDHIAMVRGNGCTVDRVSAYLPDGWSAMEWDDGVMIAGDDRLGLTFAGYVAPRLASGMLFATRIGGGL